MAACGLVCLLLTNACRPEVVNTVLVVGLVGRACALMAHAGSRGVMELPRRTHEVGEWSSLGAQRPSAAAFVSTHLQYALGIALYPDTGWQPSVPLCMCVCLRYVAEYVCRACSGCRAC